MMKLTPEQQFEVEASTMSREQLYNLAKRLWCENNYPKNERLAHEIAGVLFVNGAGEQADRLVLELPGKRAGGGWCYQAVVDRAKEVLEKD
jgi:hypothetical protein